MQLAKFSLTNWSIITNTCFLCAENNSAIKWASITLSWEIWKLWVSQMEVWASKEQVCVFFPSLNSIAKLDICFWFHISLTISNSAVYCVFLNPWFLSVFVWLFGFGVVFALVLFLAVILGYLPSSKLWCILLLSHLILLVCCRTWWQQHFVAVTVGVVVTLVVSLLSIGLWLVWRRQKALGTYVPVGAVGPEQELQPLWS